MRSNWADDWLQRTMARLRAHDPIRNDLPWLDNSSGPITIRDFARTADELSHDCLLTNEVLMNTGDPKTVAHKAFALFSYPSMVAEEPGFLTEIMV